MKCHATKPTRAQANTCAWTKQDHISDTKSATSAVAGQQAAAGQLRLWWQPVAHVNPLLAQLPEGNLGQVRGLQGRRVYGGRGVAGQEAGVGQCLESLHCSLPLTHCEGQNHHLCHSQKLPAVTAAALFSRNGCASNVMMSDTHNQDNQAMQDAQRLYALLTWWFDSVLGVSAHQAVLLVQPLRCQLVHHDLVLTQDLVHVAADGARGSGGGQSEDQRFHNITFNPMTMTHD
jgi:hypothetical protein